RHTRFSRDWSSDVCSSDLGGVPDAVDPARFSEDAERELASAVDAAIADTDAALRDRDYVAVLGRLARLRPQVDAFFDQVMVNVEIGRASCRGVGWSRAGGG